MLTTIDKKELPMLGNRKKSELRVFAEETLAEFLENSKLGDVAEVTGAPLRSEDPTANAIRLVTALRRASVNHSDEVERFRRGSRVFLERIKPFRPKNIKPYPYE